MPPFRHPGHDGSMDLGFGPDPEPLAQDEEQGTVTLSQDQFSEMLDRLQGARGDAYAQQIGQPVYQQPVQQITIDDVVGQLPNPAQDPDGFRRNLAGMLVNARSELANMAVASAQNTHTRSSALDNAWTMLQENYPEVAAHPDLIELATSRARQEMEARGGDFVTALAQNTESIVDMIAARAQTSLNNIHGFGPGEVDETGIERGDMIRGGSPRPGLPRQQQRPAGGLVNELQSIQRELGIY